MSEAELLFQKLFVFFNVFTINELADKLNVKPTTVSSWRQRNSIKSIASICKEHDIYNEIFEKDINQTNVITADNGSVGQMIGSNNIGIQKRKPKKKKLQFEEEYIKLENLAAMGMGLENYAMQLEELKNKIKESV